MCIVRRFAEDLISQDHQFSATVQLGVTASLTVIAAGISYFNKNMISYKYVFTGGITTLAISLIIDSSLNVGFDLKNHPRRKTYNLIKARFFLIQLISGLALFLLGHAFHSRGMPIRKLGFYVSAPVYLLSGPFAYIS